MNFTFHKLLSGSQFDCLNFCDVRELSEDQLETVMKSMDIALTTFLDKIGFQHCLANPDRRLRKDLWQWSAENLSTVCVCGQGILDEVLDEAAACVEYYYPLAGHETRLQLAIGLAAAISADDHVTADTTKQSFSAFQYSVWAGLPEDTMDDWVQMYLGMIRNFTRYFGDIDVRAGAVAASGWANYVEASFTEDSFSKKLPPHLEDVPNGHKGNNCCPEEFPSVFRSHTGISGPFILGMFYPSKDSYVPFEYWMTSISAVSTYINILNDLFSFPKELRARETYNYMSLQTRAKQQNHHESMFTQQHGEPSLWTFRDTVCETMDLCYRTTMELDNAFVEFPKLCCEADRLQWNTDFASQAWIAFRHRYLSWHINRKRYHLDSLKQQYLERRYF